MDLPSTLREPSSLFYQKDTLRRSIILAYWVVIILALPLWWSTTSIKRLSLPSARLVQQTQRRLQLPITICLESNDSFVEQVRQALHNLAFEEPLRWKGISVDVVSQATCSKRLSATKDIMVKPSSSVRRKFLCHNSTKWGDIYRWEATLYSHT